MAYQIEDIAARIRALREIAGVSAESVSKDLGVSIEDYGAWESGTRDIPVGILFEMAGRFRVDLSELITGESPRLHTYCLTRAGKGPSVSRRSSYAYQSLAHNFARKRAEPFFVEVDGASGDKPMELNSHPGQEFDYVVSGRLLVSVGGRELVLEAGDSLFYDSSEPHGMAALDGRPARFLAVIL